MNKEDVSRPYDKYVVGLTVLGFVLGTVWPVFLYIILFSAVLGLVYCGSALLIDYAIERAYKKDDE